MPCGPPARRSRRTCSASLTLTPGQGVDFTALRNTLLFVAAVYILSSLFAWGAVVHHGRRHPADRLPDAPRRRRQAVAAAAALLRQPPARRHAEPRHQRHRQHRELAPADADPADHRAVHDHRRHRDHVLDQPAAGGHLAADGARCRSRSRSSSPSARRSSSRPSGRRPASSTGTSRRCTPGTASSRRSAASRRRSTPSTRRTSSSSRPAIKAQFLSGTIQPVDGVHRQPQLRRRSASSAASRSPTAR